MEGKFKIEPWVINEEPTDSNKTDIFLNLENYIREIRLSHYRLGLVEQHINIYYKREKILIDNENKTLKFENLQMDMYKTEDCKSIPGSQYQVK